MTMILVGTSRRELLCWQFDLAWSLTELHLAALGRDDFLWEPAARCWTVRPLPDGTWVPDWEVPEPDPVPVPTIGWISWHIGWWWSVATDHAQGRPPRDRTAFTWPGDGDVAIRWLRDLRSDWIAVLDGLTDADLDAPAAFPWGAEAGLTVAHMIGWVNAELMKNVAEIGQLRLLRVALHADHGARSTREPA